MEELHINTHINGIHLLKNSEKIIIGRICESGQKYKKYKDVNKINKLKKTNKTVDISLQGIKKSKKKHINRLV